MARRRRSLPTPESSATDAAINAIGAEELRELVRDIIPWLDEATHARLVNMLVDRAARSQGGWVPAGPSDKDVTEIVAFADAAQHVGHADPSDIDDFLRQGSNAFLGKRYDAAMQIFSALLIPIGEGDIDLGQHEMVDEVLGVDLAECAAQYVVSAYMTASPTTRSEAVVTAIGEMDSFGHVWEPLHHIERIAVEPLPEFDAFLQQWRALVEARVGTARSHDWERNEDRWLREVIGRMEGIEGLAKMARTSKRAEDLRSWCDALVDAKDWSAAVNAYDEAAKLVTDKQLWRGEFLDGAALAAQVLGATDLPALLERAWREAPGLARLLRWLGSATDPGIMWASASAALSACPKKADRQRAVLFSVLGDLGAAADLLAKAPGLGWSHDEHPGHVLFPLFSRLLGGPELPVPPLRDFDVAAMLGDHDEPRLATPGVAEVLARTGRSEVTDPQERSAMLTAMKVAAEKRLTAIVENKRRRHYGQVAGLVAAAAVVDPSQETTAWIAGIRAKYRRYYALQEKFDSHLRRR
jgi:hypothetical protein